MSSSVNASVRQAVEVLAPSKRQQRKLTRRRTQQRILLLHKYAATWIMSTVNKRVCDISNHRPDFGKHVSPYVRFRRIAKAIALMLKVCKICKRIVHESVMSEDWFTLIDQFVAGDERFYEGNPGRRPRPFVTFLPDEDKGRLIELSFDKSEFSRENRSDHLLTPEVRKVLQTNPSQRTMSQQSELVRFLRRLSTDFNGYPMEMQRMLAQHLYYDRYYPSRVLTRQGLMADRVYFVLSGTLIEKAEGSRLPRELKTGDRFGEADIVCACPRRSTVVTKTSVEILSVHRNDYRVIFNMADDSNNPKYLEICRQNVVFQHFPIRKLIENSGTWAILSYKYGRLMVQDSNDTEWIYIMKSGEARVVKHLHTTHMDVEARKKKHQEKNSQTKEAKDRVLLEFVSDNKYYASSQYKAGRYTLSASQRSLKSAPVVRETASHPLVSRMSISHQTFSPARLESALGADQSPDETVQNLFRVRPKSLPFGCQEAEPKVSLPKSQTAISFSKNNLRESEVSVATRGIPKTPSSRKAHISAADLHGTKPLELGYRPLREQNPVLIQTPTDSPQHVHPPQVLPQRQTQSGHQLGTSASKVLRPVPPFVQLECLRAGQVFGLRSCLDPEERGPSVSLISAGCEVLQISKKFFMKHADEAVMGLIRVQCRPFPSEEDMLDRLDDSLDWQDYKQTTLNNFFKHRGRPSHAQPAHRATQRLAWNHPMSRPPNIPPRDWPRAVPRQDRPTYHPESGLEASHIQPAQHAAQRVA